jgi:NhaP-type Na+/H+ or K+/H+ antiporter
MEYLLIAFIGMLYVVYSLTIRQLELHEVTGPMFFVIGGFVLAWLMPYEENHLTNSIDMVLPLVELTLSIFLFSDAAKSKLAVLKHSFQYPSLLLFIALPLTLLLGMGVASLFFDELPIISLGLLAVVLTPTDAALSKDLFASKDVPEKIREGINTESGLNDGLCVPIFILFLLFAHDANSVVSVSTILEVFGRELGIAIALAMVSVAIFVPALNFAMQRHYFANNTSPFLLIGFVMVLFSLTQYLQGSGFIAVFVAGLLFDRFCNDQLRHKLVRDSEYLADFVSLLIWFVFGSVFVYLIFPRVDYLIVLYGLLSATLIRIVPVMLSLQFTTLNLKERFTFAWFGPRGLASIVFTLMIIEADIAYKYEIATITMTTILCSVFIHGISTRPLTNSFKSKNK